MGSRAGVVLLLQLPPTMLAQAGAILRKSFIAAVFLFAGSAAAAGYDDFTRGIAAAQRGDSEAAIAAYTAAIGQSDLSQSLLPLAYRGRGLAYLHMDRCESALADFDAALKLRPDDLDTLVYHAEAHICMHDLASAEGEMTAIVSKTPTASTHRVRGSVRWRMGNFAGAAEDYADVLRIDPADAYDFLWLQLARQRAGSFDPKLAQNDGNGLKLRNWPGAVASYYLGDDDADEVLRAAARPDREPAEEQICEAEFFIGEWALASKDIVAGKAHLQNAVGRCAPHSRERITAMQDLKGMPQ